METPVYCPDSIIGITSFSDKATPEFVEFLLRVWKPRLKELAPDAARANLNLERLRPLQAISPDLEKQKIFSRIAKDLRSLVLTKNESVQELNNLLLPIQKSAFQGKLDLSRLKLDSEAEPAAPTPPPKPLVPEGRYKRLASFIATPKVEKKLLALEIKLDGPGDSISWDEDYFKYRTLTAEEDPWSDANFLKKPFLEACDAAGLIR